MRPRLIAVDDLCLVLDEGLPGEASMRPRLIAVDDALTDALLPLLKALQ